MKIRLIHPSIGEFAFPVLPGRAVVVGRSGPDVDVELNWDSRVSRRHAELSIVNGMLWVRDLGSKNGTWRGGERMTGPAPVRAGGTVSVGDTVIVAPDAETIDLLFDEETSPLGHVPSGDREEAYQSTVDLRQHSQDLSLPITKPARVERLVPARPSPPGSAAAEPRLPRGRFTVGDELEVQLSGPAALRTLWRDHLSRGGVFVEVAEVRPAYHRIGLTLATPHGSVSMPAIVVHASEPARARSLGVPAGLGLELGPLPEPLRAAILAYAEQRTPTLSMPSHGVAPPRAVALDSAISLARMIVEGLDRVDVYALLEIDPASAPEAAGERIQSIAATLAEAARDAPPAKRARLEGALLTLGRLQHVLGDPIRRLEHDLANGHVRAAERLAAARAGTGPSVAELRRVWQQVAPERADKAAYLTRKAFTARQRGDLDLAIEAARAALEENPFFEELRPTAANWERQRDGHELETARPRPRPLVGERD